MTRKSRGPENRPAEAVAGTLYLLPGHLGNPRDLSLRTRELLVTADVVVVEDGATRSWEALLDRADLEVSADVVGLPEVRHAQHAVVVADVVARLGAGASVALFGLEEGIPGFQDPGEALLRAAAAAGVRTVSIGGASVMGMALMRLDLDIRAYTFLGTVHGEGDHLVKAAGRVSRLLAALPGRHAVVVFATRSSAIGLLDAVAAEGLVVAASVDLTRTTEAYLRGPWGPVFRAHLVALHDAAKVVLTMVSSKDATEDTVVVDTPQGPV